MNREDLRRQAANRCDPVVCVAVHANSQARRKRLGGTRREVKHSALPIDAGKARLRDDGVDQGGPDHQFGRGMRRGSQPKVRLKVAKRVGVGGKLSVKAWVGQFFEQVRSRPPVEAPLTRKPRSQDIRSLAQLTASQPHLHEPMGGLFEKRGGSERCSIGLPGRPKLAAVVLGPAYRQGCKRFRSVGAGHPANRIEGGLPIHQSRFDAGSF